MARFFFHDDVFDELDDLFAAGAAAENVSQIVLGCRKETCADLAVGGETDAGAGAAEHFGDGGDDADLTATSVGELIFPRGFAAA